MSQTPLIERNSTGSDRVGDIVIGILVGGFLATNVFGMGDGTWSVVSTSLR